jgi:cellulose biosynthesis protein BcsQ
MENSEILKSQAFKVINKMIDDKAKQIDGYISLLKDIVTMPPGVGFEFRVNVRTSEETGKGVYGEEKKFPIRSDFIERVKWFLEEIDKEKSMISDLQSFKLKLLNDWDFTKGDDRLQKEIFGNDS